MTVATYSMLDNAFGDLCEKGWKYGLGCKSLFEGISPVVVGASYGVLSSAGRCANDLFRYIRGEVFVYSPLEYSIFKVKVTSHVLEFSGCSLWASAGLCTSSKVCVVAAKYIERCTLAGAVLTGIATIVSYYASFMQIEAADQLLQKELVDAVSSGNHKKESSIALYELGRNVGMASKGFTFTVCLITSLEIGAGICFASSVVTSLVVVNAFLIIADISLNVVCNFKGIENKYFPLTG